MDGWMHEEFLVLCLVRSSSSSGSSGWDTILLAGCCFSLSFDSINAFAAVFFPLVWSGLVIGPLPFPMGSHGPWEDAVD